MVSCHTSRLACPFSSLDHLLGLQNGTARAVSATPIIPNSHACPDATARAVSVIFHASPTSNTLLKPWDHGGTSSSGLRHKKSHSRFCPILQTSCPTTPAGSWSCGRGAGQPAWLRASRPPTPPCDVWPLDRGLSGAWTWMM